MNYLPFLIATVSSVESSTDQIITSEPFWNATNVLAMILTAVLSAIVSWKIAKANTNVKNLSYSIKRYPILDYKFQSENARVPLKEIKIMYGDTILPNPCLVIVEIVNSGNRGIENPPILISNTENIEMIPLEVEDVPKGYFWKIETEDPYSCRISVSLINPKQKLRASFFMNKTPKKPLDFSCAMCDLQCHEVSGNIDKPKRENASFKIPYGAALGGMVVLLTLMLQTEILMRIKDFLFSEFHVYSTNFDIYILAIPILAWILSYVVPRKFNEILISHRSISRALSIGNISLAIVLLYLILNNVLRGYDLQLTIGVITIILFSVSIHIIHLLKKA